MMRAEAEVQPLLRLADELVELEKNGEGALEAYVRSAKLALLSKAKRVVAEVKP